MAPSRHAKFVDKTRIIISTLPEQEDEDEDEDDAPSHKYYLSKRILGVLFRAVNEKKIWEQEICQPVPQSETTIWDRFRSLMRDKITSLDITDFDFDGHRDKALQLRNV